ncbi:TPA: hypothetical protein N0F65_003892, partial [Lagenidium giganteum]
TTSPLTHTPCCKPLRTPHRKSRKRYRSSSSSSSDDSSSDDDHSSDSDDEERRSKKSRKSKKEHKRKHKKHKKKKKKARTKDNDESSPVRLSSFFQNGTDVNANAIATANAADKSRFLQLLREGVAARVHTATQAQPGVQAWQALAWRDAHSTEPFFHETVCGRLLKIKQILQGELNGFGTGLTVWPAACVLIKFLEHCYGSTTNKLRDQYVVELGSGTGAVGIAAALLDAERVVVSDVGKLVFLMHENIDLCRAQEGGHHINVEAETYEWGGTPTPQLMPQGRYPDILLVSDCILPRLYPIEPLVEALVLLSQLNHTKVYISYEDRYYQHFSAKEMFWKQMNQAGFDLRCLGEDELHPLYRAPDIEIWEAAKENAPEAVAWWCGSASSETELLSAAVLCAAVASAKRDGPASLADIEAHVRASPLPHQLQLPVLKCTPEYVLMETTQAVVCALRVSSTTEVLDAVLGATVPLTQPYVYRYGGARIHLPFWKRAQRVDLPAVYRQAEAKSKMLLFCGHSISGSVAHLALCELVYQRLPAALRQRLERRDFEVKKKDLNKGFASEAAKNALVSIDELLHGVPDPDALWEHLPRVMSVGFGAPYWSSHELTAFLRPLQLQRNLVTFVNEFDCIPGVLNVAQSAAMLTKTTERFVTITKATKTLLNLLPTQMQQCLAGGSHVTSATSAYVSMSLSLLQNTFQKLRAHSIVKELDCQYAPCGTYIFLKKDSGAFQLLDDTAAIFQLLASEDATTRTITGNAVLQHLMPAYVSAVAKRSTSIHINASMNYYERLNLPRDASPKQIRAAYKASALKWHPDRWSQAAPHERVAAEQVFKLLAESYEVLSDPDERKAYDEHLARSPTLTEEFVRHGTVNGMTLDEAIATFRDVLDGASSALSRVSTRFTSSSSSAVGQPIRRAAAANRQSLVVNNHDNLFAPDRVRIARKVGLGADQQEKILYVQPDDVLPTDVAAPTNNNPAASTGMRTISVVGGAVAVGAGVALLVNAWSQYTESSRKRKQADAVRNMPGEYLLLLMDDHRTQRRHQHLLQGESQKAPAQAATEGTCKSALVQTAARADAVTVVSTEKLKQLEQEEEELMDEFFDCLTDYEEVSLEAHAEEEFFDCLQVAEAMATLFEDDSEATAAYALEIEQQSMIVVDNGRPTFTAFPLGASVATPFGVGVLEDWRENDACAVVRYAGQCVGYIRKQDISRGASQAVTIKSDTLESKRQALAMRVIEAHKLADATTQDTIKGLVEASKDGAIDSGIRAAGGVVLAKGMARTSTRLGGAVAAPLAIASILVDIGKEYYDYRQKQTERQTLGVLSKASESVMMRDFRLKVGQHIASGTAAAAGASVGAYSFVSAIGFWTGVGMTGPVGVVAATGAAVVGGVLGFFAGSKAYNGYTSAYFASNQAAKEHIDRLELGARVLFNEYDPDATGSITNEECIKIMTKLYEASGAVSSKGYELALAVLRHEDFEGPVTWAMFWEWVSSEAAKSLRKLDDASARATTTTTSEGDASWWSSYMSYFSYGPAAGSTVELASPEATMYPTVRQAQKFKHVPAAEELAAQHHADCMVLRAQIEYLVNARQLTECDAFQLEQYLESDDPELRAIAVKTIATLHEAHVDSKADDDEEEGGIIADGFCGSAEPEAKRTTATATTKSTSSTTASHRPRSPSRDQEQLDAFCSLMSSQALQNYLQTHHAVAPASAKHEDLHCLALLTAGPPSASAIAEGVSWHKNGFSIIEVGPARFATGASEDSKHFCDSSMQLLPTALANRDGATRWGYLAFALSMLYLVERAKNKHIPRENMLSFCMGMLPTELAHKLLGVNAAVAWWLRRSGAPILSGWIGSVAGVVQCLAFIKLVGMHRDNVQAKHAIKDCMEECGTPPEKLERFGDLGWKDWVGVLCPVPQQVALPLRFPSVKKIKTVTYAHVGKSKTTKLLMDVYKCSSGRSNAPIFLYIHGGGWVMGTRTQAPTPLIYQVASRGWVVCVIDYRLSPKIAFPLHLIDSKRAVAYLRRHARSAFNADPNFIVVGGESAGGHLASLVALSSADKALQPGFEDVDTSVRACVDTYGVHDFKDRHGIYYYKDGGHGFVRYLELVVMQKNRQDASDDYEKASPISWLLENTPWPLPDVVPPFMLTHGTHDTLVPFDDSVVFYDQLQRFRQRSTPLAVRDVFLEVPGAHHAFNYMLSPRSLAYGEAVGTFLDHVYETAKDDAAAIEDPLLHDKTAAAAVDSVRGVPTTTSRL